MLYALTLREITLIVSTTKASKWLQHYDFGVLLKEGDEFLSNIVTEDETWVTYAKSETTKRQSRSDINPVHQWSQKVLTNNLNPQIDGHVFLNLNRIILSELMQQGASTYKCWCLLRDIKEASKSDSEL